MRVLLTGSSGWLGRFLAPRLRQGGHHVTGLDLAPGADTYVVGTRAALGSLEGDGPVLPRIRSLLLGILEPSRGKSIGCLLGNTAVELAPGDVAATDTVRTGFALLEDAFERALVHGRATGELPERGDAAAQARLLLVLFQGLHVLAQAEPDPARLTDAVDAALAALR